MKRLIILLFCLNAWVARAQTSTVTLTSERQYIRGFGGINVPEWTGDLTAAQRTTAFGNGTGEMGLTVLRVFVNDDKTQWNKALATALRAQQLGATIFATPWNPPASMCETVTRNNRQEKRLKYDSYSAYAQHLIDFNNYMKTNGVSLYAMSFANEPDYGFDWTWYSIDEVYNFTKNIAGTLRVNGIKVITAESFSYNKSYYDQVLNDPAALANIDIIGTHLYGSNANSPVSLYNYSLADQKAVGKERWMTEHYTNSDANSADIWPDANDVSYEIYRCMVEGEMSVYTWWYIRRQYGPMKEDGTISKRGYCMAQYCKFIRPGYKRVDATKNPASGVYMSAYKKGDDVVVVAVNRSTSSQTITISVPGTKVTTWEKYVTSGSKSLAKEANINSGTGSFQITLDPQSTTSFVGTAPLGNPTVALTSPVTGTTFNAPATITLSATASDPGGTVSTVQFYNGATLLGSATNSPYSYTWSTVSPGIYTITAVATDNSGNKTTSAAVTITVVPLATITAAGATTFCSGGNVVLNANTGTGYTYQWKNGATSITGATASSYTATASGSYSVTVTSNSQSTTSSATTVTVNTLPVITPYAQIDGVTWNQTSTVTLCAGRSIVLGPQPTTTTGWSWTGPNGYSATSREITLASVTASQSGTYTATYTDGNTCKATSAFTLTVNAIPNAPTVTTPVTYCQNATASVLTASGTNLKWYTVATGGTGSATVPTPTTTATGTTNYYVSQTTNNCESARALIVVTVNALPTPTITTSTPTTFCTGGSVLLTAGTGTSYKWMNGTTITGATTQTYTASTAGSYTVEVTNGSNCKATSTATTVTVNAIPNAPTVTTPVIYCQNASATALTASGTNLKWYTAATGGTGSAAAPTPETATAGTTNYYVSQTTNTCESSRAVIAVTVNAISTATITTNGSTAIIQGSSVVLTAGSGSSYRWMNDGTTISGATAQSYTVTDAGSYSVEVTNSNNCIATSSATDISVSVNQPSVITITSPKPNATVSGAIVISVDVTDPDGSITLVEFLDGNTVIGTSTTAPYTFIWDNPRAGAHSITVRVTDSNGGVTTSAPVSVTSGVVTTGVQSMSSIQAVVYPNPSSGDVYIETDADLSGASFTLVDMLGREVLLSAVVTSSGARIDVSSLSEGTYVFIIKQDNSILRKKITVIK